MKLPFSIFLALKYLRPKRTILSVVTVISILGVSLGVAVLVIVLSVMSGFDELWKDKILGFNAHITVSSYGHVDNAEDISSIIEDVEGVTGVAPFILNMGFVQHGDNVHTPLVKGMDPLKEASVSEIPSFVKEGSFFVDDETVMIGSDLALRLGVQLGDELLIYSPQQFVKQNEFALPEELVIGGIYEVGMWDYDMGYILCSLETARNLANMERGVQGLQVMTSDPYRAGLTAERIREKLGGLYDVRTWMEMNRQLFSALRVEKNMMFFLLIFITIVAAFSIMNTLITVTVQKTHEIGLLKALGFSSGHVMGVFFWQGWISGLIGIMTGTALGLTVLHYRNVLMHWISRQFHLELFPKELYRLEEIPAVIQLQDIGVVVLTVMVICTLAGIVPAWRAAQLDPAKALRSE